MIIGSVKDEQLYKELLKNEPEQILEWLELELHNIKIDKLSKMISLLEKQNIIYKMKLSTYNQIYSRIAAYKKERKDMISYNHHMIKTAKNRDELKGFLKIYGDNNSRTTKELKKAIELESAGFYKEALSCYKNSKYIPGILWMQETIHEIAQNPKSISDLKLAIEFYIQQSNQEKVTVHLEKIERKLLFNFNIKEFQDVLLAVENQDFLPLKYKQGTYLQLNLLYKAENLYEKKEYYQSYFELKQLLKVNNDSKIIIELINNLKNYIVLPETFFKKVSSRKGYVLRKNQILMSELVQEALCTNNTVMLEAAVGIGKSYGYLVPALLKRNDIQVKKAIIISTSSLVLQDQLVTKDIPTINTLLQELYGYESVNSIIGKGKTNFGCSQRIETYIELLRKEIKITKQNGHSIHDLVKVKNHLIQFLDKSTFLDKNDVDTKIINPEIWREINADKCACKDGCKYVSYREELSNHNGIIVCNHQQLLAYLRNENNVTRKSIFPELAKVDAIIVDEAHKLEDAAKTIFTTSFTLRSLKDFYKHVKEICKKKRNAMVSPLRYFKKLDQLNVLLQNQIEILGSNITSWIYPANFEDDNEKNEVLLETDGSRYKLNLGRAKENFNNLYKYLKEMKTIMEDITYHEDAIPYILQLNITNYIDVIQRFYQRNEYISFIEKSQREQWIFSNMRKSYSAILNQQLMSLSQPIILVSGTLRVNNSFEYMQRKIGYTNNFLRPTYLNNTFNYREKRLVYIPKHLPSPSNRDHQYYSEITTEILRLLQMTRGRSLILFTNFKDLDEVYLRLKSSSPYKLLKQKRNGFTEKLIQEFKADKKTCLLASGSFFEGFDVPGESLENVIIVKLPYPVLDPVLEVEIKAAGRQRMQKVLLPKMAIQLNQAIGRLIRKETDKGIIAILDSRLHRKGYIATELVHTSIKPSTIFTNYEELEAKWELLKAFDPYL